MHNYHWFWYYYWCRADALKYRRCSFRFQNSAPCQQQQFPKKLLYYDYRCEHHRKIRRMLIALHGHIVFIWEQDMLFTTLLIYSFDTVTFQIPNTRPYWASVANTVLSRHTLGRCYNTERYSRRLLAMYASIISHRPNLPIEDVKAYWMLEADNSRASSKNALPRPFICALIFRASTIQILPANIRQISDRRSKMLVNKSRKSFSIFRRYRAPILRILFSFLAWQR